MTMPYYIIWRTDGLQTANKIKMYCEKNYPQFMPNRFDIISYTGIINDFENINQYNSLKNTNWNVIKEITETQQLPNYQTWVNATADEIEPGSTYKTPYFVEHEFDATEGNYFGIKVHSSFASSNNPAYDNGRMTQIYLYGLPASSSRASSSRASSSRTPNNVLETKMMIRQLNLVNRLPAIAQRQNIKNNKVKKQEPGKSGVNINIR